MELIWVKMNRPALTPAFKLAVQMMPSLALRTVARNQPTSWFSGAGEGGLSGIPPVRLNATHEKQHDNDDQDDSDNTHAAMAEAVAVSAEAATEPPKQKDDENDDEYKSKRHDLSPIER